ncbi:MULTISPECIES: anti-sigma factor [unclassified Cryobacterium]|uniref:anti-sigma factor n=1 Tax=unclassified Cryobacterium TaxID=2649013 RepID=UPI0014479606|nr:MULTISPECIES: anti-sigma factor [unclassified Cryobacterium]
MRHVDPDTLALLGMGEEVADSEYREHIAQCPECASELANYSRAARVGRATLGAGELLEPSPRVWDRISDELGITEEPTAEVVELAPRRRRWVPLVAVAASVALLASLGIVLWQFAQPSPPTVIATATLEAFPAWPGATGKAVVEQQADGTRVVHIDFDAPSLNDAYEEVWLISSDATRLVSLGTASGPTATLPIPDGIDLSTYDLVDVSAEPYDGNPTHSGDSIVRGQLE